MPQQRMTGPVPRGTLDMVGRSVVGMVRPLRGS